MDKIYTITLADGTVLDSLKLSGNTFISKVSVDAAIFESNCSPVVINDGEKDEIHPNMEFVQAATNEPGEYWFILRDFTKEELASIKTRADIEYLAMMCDVEL
ncbi:MAG: hypothetical protein IKY27_00120 [Bacteroidales bacterium]|nr:hypothetical protein [Bacteroidales bacterium]